MLSNAIIYDVVLCYVMWCFILYGCVYIYMIPSSAHEVPPPEWDGSPGSTPLPFYLQAIGNISEVQPRIC